MDEDVLFFFREDMAALPIFELFRERVLAEIPAVRIKVQRSQISFYNSHMFACVSFAKVRKKADCPDDYIVVTFGLPQQVFSARIAIATEPYPGRWTHHVLLSDQEEIDEELIAWIKQAAVFSAQKR